MNPAWQHWEIGVCPVCKIFPKLWKTLTKGSFHQEYPDAISFFLTWPFWLSWLSWLSWFNWLSWGATTAIGFSWPSCGVQVKFICALCTVYGGCSPLSGIQEGILNLYKRWHEMGEEGGKMTPNGDWKGQWRWTFKVVACSFKAQILLSQYCYESDYFHFVSRSALKRNWSSLVSVYLSPGSILFSFVTWTNKLMALNVQYT